MADTSCISTNQKARPHVLNAKQHVHFSHLLNVGTAFVFYCLLSLAELKTTLRFGVLDILADWCSKGWKINPLRLEGGGIGGGRGVGGDEFGGGWGGGGCLTGEWGVWWSVRHSLTQNPDGVSSPRPILVTTWTFSSLQELFISLSLFEHWAPSFPGSFMSRPGRKEIEDKEPGAYNHSQKCWDDTNSLPPPPPLHQCWNISCT